MTTTGNASNRRFVFAAATMKMDNHMYSKVLRGTVIAQTPIQALEEVVRGFQDRLYSAVVGPDTGKGLVTEAAARYVSPQARRDYGFTGLGGATKPLVQVLRHQEQ